MLTHGMNDVEIGEKASHHPAKVLSPDSSSSANDGVLSGVIAEDRNLHVSPVL